MDVAATQYLLGIRPTLKGLLIDPSIPAEWDGFTIERSYRGHQLHIYVENPEHIQHGVKQIEINGTAVDISASPCVPSESFENCMDAHIRVVLGSSGINA